MIVKVNLGLTLPLFYKKKDLFLLEGLELIPDIDFENYRPL